MSSAAWKVVSSVAMPRITSTSCIIGTGFIKWMPIKCSGRSVEAASRVTEIDEVLVARRAFLEIRGQRSWNILRLMVSSSVAASMTRSRSCIASRFSAVWMRFSADSTASSLMSPRAAWRRMFLVMRSSALPSCSELMSSSMTSKPASERTWAMPLPIWPAPITPMRSIPMIRSLTLFIAELGQLFVHLRDRLEQVCDQSVIGDLEDRCFFVLVDGGDDLGVLHAGQMLNGAGDADRDVEIGSHDLAGLADLIVVRHEARIDRRARRADRGVQLVRDLVEHVEIVARLHAAAAGDYDLRRGEFGTLRLRQLFADEFRDAWIGCRRNLLNSCRTALARRLEGGGADGDDFLAGRRLHG